MTNGETVYATLTAVDGSGTPKAFVTQWEVIDAENRVVRGASGARVVSSFETLHATEREAWEQAAKELLASAETVREKAQECLQKAAAAGIVQVPA